MQAPRGGTSGFLSRPALMWIWYKGLRGFIHITGKSLPALSSDSAGVMGCWPTNEASHQDSPQEHSTFEHGSGSSCSVALVSPGSCPHNAIEKATKSCGIHSHKCLLVALPPVCSFPGISEPGPVGLATEPVHEGLCF